MVSDITDKIMPQIEEWQSRPLSEVYPIVFEEVCMNGYVSKAVKFEDFAKQWHEDYAKPKYKKTTLYKTEHVIKRINEEIGHKRMDKITARDIQALIKTLSKGNEAKGYKPMSAKTVKNYISYVSTVFEYAIRLDMMSRNPCARANIPTGKAKEREMYTIEEAQLFIDTPKTETSQRTLKLPEVIFERLRSLQEFYADEATRLGTKWEENNFVFKNQTGKVLSPLAPNSWLHKFCKRENLRYVNIHSFRHRSISMPMRLSVHRR